MILPFLIYDTTTRSLKGVITSNVAPGSLAAGRAYLQHDVPANWESYRVNAALNGIELKPALSITPSATQVAADGVTEVVLTGIPVGATMVVGEVVETIDDGQVEFSVDLEGFYSLQFSHPDYLFQEIVIEGITPA